MGQRYVHLSPQERGVIFAMKLQGCSVRAIARTLNRSASTISRELRRNGWRSEQAHGAMGRPPICGGYDPQRAASRAGRLCAKARRPRKLDAQGPPWSKVRTLLRQHWSPEQIAGTLRLGHPHQPHLQVSHETIYTAIYAAPRGALRRELVSLLRQGRGARRPRSRGQDRRGSMPDLPSIHLRPPEAGERLLPGHWEGDLIKGAANRSAVGTLVCRKTLFVMLVKMDGASALQALKGFEAAFSPLDARLRKTLTYDQGKEMALHRKLAQSTGLKIYFADPHSPWQRGICENTNGLLRQYLPKGTDLGVYSQRQLDAIAWSLNTRPRKTLGFKTPAQVFFEDCFALNLDLQPVVALGL